MYIFFVYVTFVSKRIYVVNVCSSMLVFTYWSWLLHFGMCRTKDIKIVSFLFDVLFLYLIVACDFYLVSDGEQMVAGFTLFCSEM